MESWSELAWQAQSQVNPVLMSYNYTQIGRHVGEQAGAYLVQSWREGKNIGNYANDASSFVWNGIKQPWEDFGTGWNCGDAYLLGRGTVGIANEVFAIASIAAGARAGLQRMLAQGRASAANKISMVNVASELDPYITREFGRVILDNPVASRAYQQLQAYGTKIALDYGKAPRNILGQASVDAFSNDITIFMANNGTARNAVSTMVRESRHIGWRFRGYMNTLQDEYYAFRREFLFEKGRRPTLSERQQIWDKVQELYPKLPIGRSPFGQ